MNFPRVPASDQASDECREGTASRLTAPATGERHGVGPFPSSGIILLDKSPGPTSHDAVLWARRVLGHGRVGHCGSLDPFAQGLLLMGVGDALKWQDRLMAERKVYQGVFRLGLATDTDDITGKPLPGYPKTGAYPEEAAVRDVLQKFVGLHKQTVPRYSAVKVRGRPLYAWARAGVAMDLPQKDVEIFQLKLQNYAPPDVDFSVECSKGTYVRALARDAGEQLGLGATLVSLSRDRVGPFLRADAYVWGGEGEIRLPDFQRSFIPLGKVVNMLKDPSKAVAVPG